MKAVKMQARTGFHKIFSVTLYNYHSSYQYLVKNVVDKAEVTKYSNIPMPAHAA